MRPTSVARCSCNVSCVKATHIVTLCINSSATKRFIGEELGVDYIDIHGLALDRAAEVLVAAISFEAALDDSQRISAFEEGGMNRTAADIDRQSVSARFIVLEQAVSKLGTPAAD